MKKLLFLFIMMLSPMLASANADQMESLYGEWRLVGWNDGGNWFEVDNNYVDYRHLSIEIPKEGYVMAYSMVNEIFVGLLTLDGNKMLFNGEMQGFSTEVHCDIMENRFFEKHICDIKSYQLEGELLKLYYTDNDYFVFTSNIEETGDDYRPLIEEGKVWTYHYHGFDGREFNVDRIIDGDTIIGGLTYKKIYDKVGGQYQYALCEKGKKIYIVYPHHETVSLLYDFSKNAGDVINELAYPLIVASVDTIDIDGVKFRRMRVQDADKPVEEWNDDFIHVYNFWIEGVGSESLLETSIREPGNAYNLLSCQINGRIYTQQELLGVVSKPTPQDDQEEPSDYIPFVEEGKQWHMVSTSLTQYMLSDYILVNEEVVKNGKTYLRMYSRKDDMTSIHNMGLFREEDRKVYFLHPDKQEEFLIFDYSLKIGDTYETYSYDEQKMVSYKVMSIDDCLTEPEIIHYDYDQAADSMITHRRYLRKWTVCRTDNDLEKTWIEGIGSFSGPLENLYDANAISSRSILAYVDYVGENAFINPYLPFSFYDNFSGLVHGCHLPTSIIENPGSNRHSQLTYELEGNRLHVYGQIVSSCGNSYVYIIEEPTDDPLVRKLHFEKRDVEPVPTCVNLYATNFYVPGFYPNMNYIVVDNDGEEHPVINKTPQTAYRPMIEEGKVWTVGIENSGNPVQIVEYYYFDGDTIIDGKTCKQMMCQQNIRPDYPDYNNMSQSPSLTKVGAWYEENKKVYFYDEKQQYMRMMYDFSVDANDTLYLINDYLPFVIGPKQTGGIKGFKGVYRDVTMGPNAISTIWLEGVGGIDGPTINAYPEAVDHSKFLMSCTVGDEVIYLNDEYEDWTTYESAGARKNRFDFTHTIKTNPKARRRSGEDPLYGEYNDLMLGIKLDPLDDAYLVRITDESGKVVYEKAINAGNIVALSIDISTYAKGHYTITLENSNESFTGEFEAQKTGIKGVIKNNEERKYYIYNLHGQRLSSLQKGLNIVNGQKIYVK